MAIRDKNVWILLIFIIAGSVIGGLLGQVAKEVDFLWWLDYGKNVGFTSPVELDLNIIKITFAISFNVNIASIIGLAIAVSIYKLM